MGNIFGSRNAIQRYTKAVTTDNRFHNNIILFYVLKQRTKEFSDFEEIAIPALHFHRVMSPSGVSLLLCAVEIRERWNKALMKVIVQKFPGLEEE